VDFSERDKEANRKSIKDMIYSKDKISESNSKMTKENFMDLKSKIK
jgi:hypothetical protein